MNFVDYGLQNSRGFRALKVWLALQHVGRAGYVTSISEDMRLSRQLARYSARPWRFRRAVAGAEHHDIPLCAA